MKKTLRIMCVLILCVSLFSAPFSAFADASQTADVEKTRLGTTDTYYEFDAATGTLTISGEGETPGFSENGLDAPWFNWRTDSINSVIIADGITALGDYFLYQVQATSIALPDTLKKIGSHTLSYTFGITSWDLPFGLTSIGSYAFQYCQTLENIDLPDTLTSIGINAFDGCSSLKSITIPYSVKTIGTKAFYQCTALNNVTFQSLTGSVSIGSYCFTGCSELKSLTVPLNATVKTRAFGYGTTSASSKYTDVSMSVYADSNAQLYAAAAYLPYSVYDTVPVQPAVGYENTYTDDNLSSAYVYSFVPDTAETYNIYSRGDCDVNCTVTGSDGNMIANNEDISDADRNFALSAMLSAGEEYTVTVASYSSKSTGMYTLWIYPDTIESFTVRGSAVSDASADMTRVDDSLLTSLVLSISFASGLTDKVYYNADFFDGTYMTQYDTALYCGENTAYLAIGSVKAPYSLYINHRYESSEIDYTVDEDGYTLYSCALCSSEYRTDYVPTPAIKITGTAVFAKDWDGSHDSNVPYTYGEIVIYDVKNYTERAYPINADGTWQINTFNNIDFYIVNNEGKHFYFSYLVDDLEPYTVVDYGAIAVNAYDFNGDDKVNGKDYAIFIREKRAEYGADYWQFAHNFVLH